ncbi:type II toxin-antitoxin system RelE family toxin [Saccharopolyspora hattusasensis]|uniref:type II toxin-antitoxin system RelE family toxin n=1 Tax=Saccharopolyspora hattusasensis TaxID=1128679 RepID=UPI003D989ACD
MAYAVEILRDADKFLDKLARKQPKDAEAIEDAIESLSTNPRRPGFRPLIGYPGTFRYRVGNYRVCYQIDDGQLVVLVVTVSTRDDVYELLRRHLGR